MDNEIKSSSNIVNSLTVDVEDFFQVSAFEKSVNRSNWDKFPLRVESNTNRLLEIFDKHSVKATFFVLGWIANKAPNLVLDIANAGHEIACHGYSHKLIYNQSQNEFKEETIRAKSLLEDIIGQSVVGYRAASYSITKDSLWALDILADAGFKYDSSIFPVIHDRYGIPGTPKNIYKLATSSGMQLLEFPLTTTKIGPLTLPMAGGGYFRLYPYWFTEFNLRKLNSKDGKPFIFYLHPWEIDADQPRIDAGLFSKFRHYNNLDKCENRLERLLKSFKFGTVIDILNNQENIPLYNIR